MEMKQKSETDSSSNNNNSKSSSSSDKGPWLPPYMAAAYAFNVIIGIYQSLHNPQMIAFLIFSYSSLVLLLWVVRKFEEAKGNDGRRKKLLAAAWLLLTTIVCVQTYFITSSMSLTLQASVWTVVGLCTCGTFYACFLHRWDAPHMRRRGKVFDSVVIEEADNIKIGLQVSNLESCKTFEKTSPLTG